jgi:hypothetical protein
MYNNSLELAVTHQVHARHGRGSIEVSSCARALAVMRHLTVVVAVLMHASVVAAAVPTNAEEEVREANRRPSGPEHLEPQGSRVYLRHGCVVEFEESYSLGSFPPEAHWCLIEKGSAYTIRSWRGFVGRPGYPDNPATPEDESDAGVPYTERDVLSREIPAALAGEIRQLWFRAILESRFPPTNYVGTDGATYTFTVRRFAFGEYLAANVWSPSLDRPPRWMVDLGLKLYETASTNLPFGDQIAREVAAAKRKVETFYKVQR